MTKSEFLAIETDNATSNNLARAIPYAKKRQVGVMAALIPNNRSEKKTRVSESNSFYAPAIVDYSSGASAMETEAIIAADFERKTSSFMINDRYQSDYFQIGSKSLVTRIKKEAFEDLSYVLSNETKVPDFSLDPLNPLLVSECYRNYSDKDLLRRFCNYEEEAFNAIYKKYEKGIYHYILKTLDSKNKDKVEDVMQQTFMALIAIQTKGYNELYDNNYLRNFLYRVAENKTIDCIKNNPDLLDSIGEKEEKALILTEEADTQLHLKTLLGKIDKYSETLEKSLKDVAALLSQGYEAEDIAEILEVNRRTIDVRIVRLRDKLRAFVIKSSTEGEVSRLTKQDKEKDQSTSNNKPEIGLKGLIKHLFFGR